VLLRAALPWTVTPTMTLLVRAGFAAIVGVIAASAIALAQPPPAAAPARPDVLISRQLAEAFGITPGALVRLSPDSLGENARDFRVAGVYEPAPDPMRLNAAKHEVRLHLPDLLPMTVDPADPIAAGTVDAINVALTNPAEARAFARDAESRIPGIRLRLAAGARREADTFVVLERFHLAIAIVTIVASTMFLLALSVMVVDERRETVGILRLIGLTTRRILLQVLVEGLFIAVAGALFGLGLALASEGLINRYFQWRYDTALVFVRITPSVALRSIVIAVPLGALASLAASWVLLRRSVLSLARR
jgi:putative ABC transport system permease protein